MSTLAELLALVAELNRMAKEHMKAKQAPTLDQQLAKYGVKLPEKCP